MRADRRSSPADLGPTNRPLVVTAQQLAAAYPGIGQYVYAHWLAYGLFRSQPPDWHVLWDEERARWDYAAASLLVFVCREQAPLQAEAVLTGYLDGKVGAP